jgi:asparagine synthase (glutamine-hydrolysing)
MCGIAGWINLNKAEPPSEETWTTLHRMCDTIAHRGPDSEGSWIDESVALGMRRLSIIDLKTGDQPVFSCDRSVVVMMNGELYNYREIREELERKGHHFVTQTDTEIVPHLYEEYGTEFVHHLNGMFAISLWDTRRKRLVLARDRYGEKPLYYGLVGGKVIYGSEPKAITAHPAVEPEIDLDALRHYLSFDYVPAPRTIYKGLSKLPAAQLLIVENGTISTRRYWDISFERNGHVPSIEEAAGRIRDLISDAVRIRLVADVPLGVLLSGGVDSSTIAAFAVRHSTETVKTFSIGFSEDSFDESRYARQVALHLGTDHYEETLSADKAADLISDVGSWLDEPLSDPSMIPTYLLARFVRKHVTVALGGDGGDEIFAGYPMYLGHKVADAYSAIPKFARRLLINPLVNCLPVSDKNLSFEYRAKRFVRSAEFDLIARHHSWFGSFTADEQRSVLSPDVLAASTGEIYSEAERMLEGCNAPTNIERMQYLDMNLYMAEDILSKVDRASMAVSLETRAPLLDPRIGEFAATLPIEYKLRGRTGKYILKKAVEPLLPTNILKRPKKGFGIPIAQWLRGRLNPLMHDLLSPERINDQGLFNVIEVQRLIREHEQGIASHHKQLWTLLVFQLWHERFLSKSQV